MFGGRRQTRYLLGVPYLLTLILVGGDLRAQDASTGALRGTVMDAQGAAITAADIVAIRVDTGIRYHSATDSEGRFNARPTASRPNYSARAEAEGMLPQNSPPIRVEIGAATALAFKLVVAGGKENSHRFLTRRHWSRLSPARCRRWWTSGRLGTCRCLDGVYTDLSLLAPGVTQDPRGLTSSSNGDLAFGGIRVTNPATWSTALTITTASSRRRGTVSGAVSVFERGCKRVPRFFQHLRSGTRTRGRAVVNVVTKSGSNHWHGTGFYFLRDSALAASAPFVGFKPSGRQHPIRGTLGGPIKHNKVFFFAGYDQHIFNVPAVVEFADGNTVVIPKKGEEPLHHGDYEESDKRPGVRGGCQAFDRGWDISRDNAWQQQLCEAGLFA